MDLYAAPNHANILLNELGIDSSQNAFDPNNQPKQIGHHFNKPPTQKNNKYMEKQPDLEKQQKQSQDFQIPRILQPVSSITKKNQFKQQQATKKGRKKQTKRGNKNASTKNKIQSQNKQQVKIDVQTDQIAQWGQKGTKVNHYNDESQQFDNENQLAAQNPQNLAEQEQIRKRIEQKLKKYQKPNLQANKSNKSKSNSGSLKNKLQQLKKQKDQATVLGQNVINHSIEQQTEQQIIQNIPIKRQKRQEIISKQKQEQQQNDPWEKINQKTLDQKNQQAHALKNAEEINLNNYYQSLALPQVQFVQSSQPQTGFLQSLCACFYTKKKPPTEIQQQLIKVSMLQLTNKPQQTTLLKTIWTKLTNKKFLRYGEQWSQIGFQGRDPATDLRSTGILSLLTWYNFLNFDMQYALKAHQFFLKFDIPLALTHIKITSLLCSSIKKRKLEGKSWNDFMEWYYSLTYYTFDQLMQKLKKLDEIKQAIETALQRTKNNLQQARSYFKQNIKNKR